MGETSFWILLVLLAILVLFFLIPRMWRWVSGPTDEPEFLETPVEFPQGHSSARLRQDDRERAGTMRRNDRTRDDDGIDIVDGVLFAAAVVADADEDRHETLPVHEFIDTATDGERSRLSIDQGHGDWDADSGSSDDGGDGGGGDD